MAGAAKDFYDLRVLLAGFKQACFNAGVAHMAGNLPQEDRYLTEAKRVLVEIEALFKDAQGDG